MVFPPTVSSAGSATSREQPLPPGSPWGELSEVMRWLTVTHTQRWHANRHTSGSGPIYQGCFKSFPVQSDEHLLTVARYVERKPLRAKMVEDLRDWQWSSLWRRCQADPAPGAILSDWPVAMPRRLVAMGAATTVGGGIGGGSPTAVRRANGCLPRARVGQPAIAAILTL